MFQVFTSIRKRKAMKWCRFRLNVSLISIPNNKVEAILEISFSSLKSLAVNICKAESVGDSILKLSHVSEGKCLRNPADNVTTQPTNDSTSYELFQFEKFLIFAKSKHRFLLRQLKERKAFMIFSASKNTKNEFSHKMTFCCERDFALSFRENDKKSLCLPFLPLLGFV